MGETWSILRIGEVSAVDATRVRAKVTFEALEVTSDWLPIGQHGASSDGDQAFWLPAVGEFVVCGFYSDGTEHGVVLCSYYRASAAPEGVGVGKRFVAFPDGSSVLWDSGALTITALGGVTINGDVTINGNVEVNGTVLAEAYQQG